MPAHIAFLHRDHFPFSLYCEFSSRKGLASLRIDRPYAQLKLRDAAAHHHPQK